MHPSFRKAFTLIELLVVIAVIAILAVVVVLILNPAELLRQGRDSNRVSDMGTLNSAINLYNTDQSGSRTYSLGSANVVYVSIPDPSATSILGDQCQGLGLISLPSTYTYHCAASSTYRNTNGTGWIPVNFSTISSGSPLGSLPVDPTNTSSSRLYYTYITNGTQFEMTAAMESAKYQAGGSNDVISTDGGPLASVYEKGSQLGLEPLDYGDNALVGYWPLTEGSGTVAYDDSGNNNTGTWNGIQAGTSGYYSSGKARSWAGYFNGTDNYVDLGNASITEPTAAGTYSAWINPVLGCSSGGEYGNVMADENVYWDLNGVGLLCDNASGILLEVSNASTQEDTPPYVYSPNTWFLVTGTWDGSVMNFYANGILVESTPQANVVPTPLYHTFIGADPSMLPNYPFEGLIDDVRIYNRALSAVEIRAMYNGGK